MNTINKATELFETYKDKAYPAFSDWKDYWGFGFFAPQALQNIWGNNGCIIYTNDKPLNLYDKSIRNNKPEMLAGVSELLRFYFLRPDSVMSPLSLYSVLTKDSSHPFNDILVKNHLADVEEAFLSSCFCVYAIVFEFVKGKLVQKIFFADASGNFYEEALGLDIDPQIILDKLLPLKEKYADIIAKKELEIKEWNEEWQRQEDGRAAREKIATAEIDVMLENEKKQRAEAKERQTKLKTQKLELRLLFNKIEEFNHAIKDDYYHLNFSEPATDEQLKELQSLNNIPIPQELQQLYKEFGSIKNGGYIGMAMESYAFEIQPAAFWVENLKVKGNWNSCDSLGLIEMIKHSWGGDRREFDDEGSVDPAEIKYLNENYTCFGFYRFNWQLEEAYYLYFDKHQKFGWVRYHQDEFGNLWEEHLNEMLVKSPAYQSLEELLISIIHEQLLEIEGHEDEDYEQEPSDDEKKLWALEEKLSILNQERSLGILDMDLKTYYQTKKQLEEEIKRLYKQFEEEAKRLQNNK